MITNIPRFTAQMLQNTHVGVSLGVHSLREAEVFLSIAYAYRIPLLVKLPILEKEELQRWTQYLQLYMEQQGIVAGITLSPSSRLEDLEFGIQTGCQLVSFDIREKDIDLALKETQYLVNLAHQKHVAVEVLFGDFHDQEWYSPLRSSFDIQDFVNKTYCDMGAFFAQGQSSQFRYRGKDQLDMDFLEQIHNRIDKPLTLYGSLYGAKYLSEQYKQDLSSLYHHITGISEHALMKVGEKGVDYIHIEEDLQYLVDVSIRHTLRKYDIIYHEHLDQELAEVSREFFAYIYKLVQKHYELS